MVKDIGPKPEANPLIIPSDSTTPHPEANILDAVTENGPVPFPSQQEAQRVADIVEQVWGLEEWAELSPSQRDLLNSVAYRISLEFPDEDLSVEEVVRGLKATLKKGLPLENPKISSN